MKSIVRGIAFAAALASAPLFAQSYPIKPVTVIIPYPPGGVDLVARMIQPAMQQELGQPWVIEYKPGASGLIGMEYVSRAEPDGYTLLYTASNPWVVTPAMRAKTPYDPVKDFTPITNTTEGVNVIISSTSFPVSNFRELVDYAKKNPTKVSWATSGLGSFWHLDAENMNRLAGMEPISTRLLGGGFLNYYLTPDWRLTGSLLYGAGNERDGARLDLGVQRLAMQLGAHHRLSFTAGVSFATTLVIAVGCFNAVVVVGAMVGLAKLLGH